MGHTKGEWIVVKSKMSTSIKCNGKSICILTSGISEVNKANGKLMVAAPDLLKALIEANNELKNMHEYVSKVRKQILENGVDCVSHVDIDGIDDIMLIGLKSEQAIKKAS